MKVALIVDPIGEAEPAGLGRAVYDFARGIMELRTDISYVLVSRKSINVAARFPGIKTIVENIVVGDHMWRTLKLVSRSDIDLVIALTPIMPLCSWRTKRITYAYDFAFMTFSPQPTRSLLWLANYWAFLQSARICVISEFTKTELLKFFPVAAKKIVVTHCGYEHVEPQPINTGEPEPYFLSVGVLKERKNTLRIIEGFEKFIRTHPHFHLKIVGKKTTSYGDRVVEYVKSRGLTDRVSVLGYVSDEDLMRLFQKASAVVYPSLLEGFGLPNIEAMVYGVPIITSNQGATAEMSGDASVLVDPYDTDSIARGMEEVVAPGAYTTYQAKGLARAKCFSWSAAAKILSCVIDEILSPRHSIESKKPQSTFN